MILYYSLILSIIYFINQFLKYVFINNSHIKSIKNIHEKLANNILRSKV